MSIAIPRLFHQIWLGPDPFPAEYVEYQRSWTRHHPGWELRLWTEADLPDDLERTESYEVLRQPAELDTLAAELEKLTSDDIKRAASAYFKPAAASGVVHGMATAPSAKQP